MLSCLSHYHKRAHTLQRLQKDLIALNKDPVPGVFALPDPDNMLQVPMCFTITTSSPSSSHSRLLQWHFAIVGPPASPYDRGIYHGALLFADDFPFSPPSIIMFTPSGRFAPGKKVTLLLLAADQRVMCRAAVHVHVRLSPRKLESAVVSGHHSVGKQPCNFARALNYVHGRPRQHPPYTRLDSYD